jgi:tryptophan synthase alpha chain
MSRISEAFANLKLQNRKGFIPFITAGDPDLPTTRELIVDLARIGSTLIELGIPFTDPMADGPVIQRASERALRHSFGIEEVLQIVADARKETNVPIILFSYFNPLLQYCQNPDREGRSPSQEALPPGQASDMNAFDFDKLAQAAKRAGVDGVLVTDLAPEEAGDFAAVLRRHDLDMIFLIAPTSTDVRLRLVAERASGFIYAVSRAGITGARKEMSAEAEKLVRRMRQFSGLPVAVGFGISTPEQVAEVWRYADAAVVGSAIVSVIETCDRPSAVTSSVRAFASSLLSTHR